MMVATSATGAARLKALFEQSRFADALFGQAKARQLCGDKEAAEAG
jgi:hypothetical protein